MSGSNEDSTDQTIEPYFEVTAEDAGSTATGSITHMDDIPAYEIAEGLLHAAVKSHRKLRIAPEERPVAIQIFGSRIPSVVAAAEIAAAADPDCIDLNFGCPARKVAGKGGGAGLLREPDKLAAMARAVVAAVDLPVTAKVRLGWDQDSINVLDITARLEQAGVRAVAVHARTRSQSYGVAAD